MTVGDLCILSILLMHVNMHFCVMVNPYEKKTKVVYINKREVLQLNRMHYINCVIFSCQCEIETYKYFASVNIFLSIEKNNLLIYVSTA